MTRKATFTKAAKADLDRLGGDNPALPGLALRKIRDLVAGLVQGTPLNENTVTGDLTDCAKIYFGPGNPPSHRIVYRTLPDQAFEVLEVVAIEARDELYVYLLAAQRLHRLPNETKPRFERTHQRIIRMRWDRG